MPLPTRCRPAAAREAEDAVGPAQLRDFSINGTVTRRAETPATRACAARQPARPGRQPEPRALQRCDAGTAGGTRPRAAADQPLGRAAAALRRTGPPPAGSNFPPPTPASDQAPASRPARSRSPHRAASSTTRSRNRVRLVPASGRGCSPCSPRSARALWYFRRQRPEATPSRAPAATLRRSTSARRQRPAPPACASRRSPLRAQPVPAPHRVRQPRLRRRDRLDAPSSVAGDRVPARGGDRRRREGRDPVRGHDLQFGQRTRSRRARRRLRCSTPAPTRTRPRRNSSPVRRRRRGDRDHRSRRCSA